MILQVHNVSWFHRSTGKMGRDDHKIIWRYDYEYEEKNDGCSADCYYGS